MLDGVVIIFISFISVAIVSPLSCEISVILLSLKNSWILVLKQHDLYSIKLYAFTLLILAGRCQKRHKRTARTLAYILGVGDNERENGRN